MVNGLVGLRTLAIAMVAVTLYATAAAGGPTAIAAIAAVWFAGRAFDVQLFSALASVR